MVALVLRREGLLIVCKPPKPRVSSDSAVEVVGLIHYAGIEAIRVSHSQFAVAHKRHDRASATRATIRVLTRRMSVSDTSNRVVSSNRAGGENNPDQGADNKYHPRHRHHLSNSVSKSLDCWVQTGNTLSGSPVNRSFLPPSISTPPTKIGIQLISMFACSAALSIFLRPTAQESGSHAGARFGGGHLRSTGINSGSIDCTVSSRNVRPRLDPRR
jgi:hypothetical protein